MPATPQADSCAAGPATRAGKPAVAAGPGLAPPRRAQPWAEARRRWLPDALTRLAFGRPLPPTREEWQRVEAGLCQGDEPMDKVVAWMFDAGPRHAKPLFDQALTRGIDTLTDPPAALVEFFRLIDTPPPWLRADLLDEGARAAQMSGYVGFYVLRDLALMGGYAYFNSFNQVLAATGSLHKDAGLRLGETGKWLQDVTASGGMARFGDGFISTIRVRLVHALVRRHLQAKGDWDTASWGLPINQIDMQATYLAFGPVTLSGARLFGVPVGRRESRAAMHLWRYIGWLSGVREEWLAITERDGLRKLFHTFLTHRLPDEKIGLMGRALRDQPLSQNLPELAGHPWLIALKRRYLYQRHISNSSLILLPRQRRQLGIPVYAVPWYPLATAPLRFAGLCLLKLRGEAAQENWRRASRAKQQRLLQSYFADRAVDLIRPAAEHPASVDYRH